MTLTVIKKQLQKYLSLSIEINADLEKSNFPKTGPCICRLIQVTLSLSRIVSLKAAEKLNCSLLVHPCDMQMDGRMAKYWFPWLIRLCQTEGLEKDDKVFVFFQLSINLIMSKRESINY